MMVGSLQSLHNAQAERILGTTLRLALCRCCRSRQAEDVLRTTLRLGPGWVVGSLLSKSIQRTG